MESFNLPLVLALLVIGSGLVWLYDILVLAKPRRAKVAAVEAQIEAMAEDNAPEEAQRLALEQAKREPMLVEYSKSFFPVLFIVFFLRSFIAEPFQIPSPSMVPTLKVGDFILVNKFSYGIRLPVLRTKVFDLGEPQRGDVMVFFPPHQPKTYFIKRVVGLPGDHIRYTPDNKFYLNGKLVEQSFVAALPVGQPSVAYLDEKLGEHSHKVRQYLRPGPSALAGEWTVPAGHYFMMGDNRNNSSDSRAWGFVPESAIVGKAVAVWMHWKEFLSVPSFSTVGTIQ